MKNYLLLAVLILFSFGAQAVPDSLSNNENCRLGVVDNSKRPNKEHVSLDLILNKWVLTDNMTIGGTTQQFFDFNEIGIVKITIASEDVNIPTTTKNMVWQVTEEGNKVLLIFTDINTDSQTTYTLNQTCDGISLTNTLLDKQLNLLIHIQG